MWLFTTIGFYSTVQNKRDATGGSVLVRAYAREHLEALRLRLPQKAHRLTTIIETPDADYPVRMVVDRVSWTRAIEGLAEEVTYGSFKGQAQATGSMDPAVRNDPPKREAHRRYMHTIHSAWSVIRQHLHHNAKEHA